MLATSIRRDQLPGHFRALPCIGKGTTSLVLQRDAVTVYMLTRDRSKMEWLRDGAAVGEWIETFETAGHHIAGMDDLPVFVVRMPLLQRPTGEAGKLARAVVREYEAVVAAARRSPDTSHGKNGDMMFQALTSHYLSMPHHPLHDLFRWASDYDALCFTFDICLRNIMARGDGTLVVVDPVYSSEVREVIDNHRGRRWERQPAAYR